MILLSSPFLKREKERGIIECIQSWDSVGRYQGINNQGAVRLWILEPYITKKTTNFLELSVQGAIQCFELLNEEDQLVKCHSRFWSLALNCKNTSQNASYGCEKCGKSNLIQFVYDGQNFRRQCVNVIDTMWGLLLFLTCEILIVQKP